ncbi:MAG: hypothetical protein CM15mP23_12710 [Cryomorphaceae bacterium]|nr:MAG: hypothetical protein CM15mP23_12710 [Cryomorphaceae bacterium]
MKLVDPKTGITLATNNIPYGSTMFSKDGDKLKKGQVICEWDPYNAVILSETTGKVEFENLAQGVTYRVEIDEQTGFQEKIISETRDKKMIPTILVKSSGKNGQVKSYNLPVGAHIVVNEGDKLKPGTIIAKLLERQLKLVILLVVFLV